MSDKIVNRVANSSLVTVDLDELYPSEKRIVFDIKDWLFQGLVLKENEFRQQLLNHDWKQYKNTYVSVICSSGAIVPTWAFMLVVVNLEPFVEKAVIGNLAVLEQTISCDVIGKLNLSIYKNRPVIIKGCCNKQMPLNAYSLLVNKLKPIAKSIMYGEACSSVPLYKRKKEL
jgi:hypothetical protein